MLSKAVCTFALLVILFMNIIMQVEKQILQEH
jgi:hypothetical protein